MTPVFFSEQITRLSSVYGSKFYNSDRIDFLWSEFGQQSESVFAKAIGFLIGNSKFAPLAPDIWDAILNIRAKEPVLAKTKNYGCSLCGNSGILRATKKIDNIIYSFDFRCQCNQYHSDKIPMWNFNDFSDFVLEKEEG